METQSAATLFDEKTAASYDKHNPLWEPGREALFSLIRQILSELPEDARILCVGAGTGSELIALASAFPGWRFTAVEPAPAMLEVCRRRAEEAGIAERCTFHEGYLEALPPSEPFEAATCLLVSQFIRDPEERSRFFAGIARRLRPGGILISSDLVLGMAPEVYRKLIEVWLRMRGSGWGEEEIEKMREVWRLHITTLTAPEVEKIIAAGGFESPVLFYQMLFIHAWFSKRRMDD